MSQEIGPPLIDSSGLNGNGTQSSLILVRHASSTRAILGVWGRRVDVPLASGFEVQLSSTKSALGDISPRTVFTSPLIRCQQTAMYLFPRDPIKIVEDFKAYHSGILEDASEGFVRANLEKYYQLSFRDRFMQPKFGEESLLEQSQRVARGFLGILRESKGSTIIVAHYSSINILAHLANRNYATSTYGNGSFDLTEGGYIELSMDRVASKRDLEERCREGIFEFEN